VNEKYPNKELNEWKMKNLPPLHFSTRHDHLSVVEYLVNQIADINAKTKDVECLILLRLLFILLLIMIIIVFLYI